LCLPLLKRCLRLLLRRLLIGTGAGFSRALGVGLLLSRNGLNHHSLLRGLLLRL
jgi:hypothetical protein